MSSSKMEKIMRMVSEDRLSSLPDDLIHNIFSFLDLEVVLQTSLLSRRWRDLWKFLHAINIDSNRVKYNKLMDWLLLQDMSNIKRLCLNLNDTSSTDLELRKMWICPTLRRYFQGFIPNCPTLNYIGGNIKTLQLVAVVVMGSSVSGQIYLDFEVVENLKMKNCNYVTSSSVNINAPRLSNLVLSDEASTLSMIRMTAPNLKKLYCKIKTEKDYTFFDLGSLVTAHVDKVIASLDNRARENELLCRSMKRHFKMVANARSLTLSACSFQILSKGTSIMTPTSISFRDVRHLKLKDWWGCNHSGVIQRIIKAFPDIDTPVSERHNVSFTTSRGEGDSKLSAKFMQCDFKSLEFSDDGRRNEFKFLESLLGRATMLKDITLTIFKEEAVYDMGGSLVMLPTTSSKESILVHPL